MTQFNFGTIVASAKSGSGLAADLNAWRDALHTGHKGGMRPDYAVAGLGWMNDVETPWRDYVFDGTDDALRGFVDPTSHRYSSAGAAAKTISSGGATAHLGDWGTLFNFSGGAAQTCAIDSKDTLIAGWWIRVIAQSVTVTIDPFGAETIDGLGTILLPAGSATTVFFDGINFWTDQNGGGASAFPVGGVIYVPANKPPLGFIRQNGALLSRDTYGGLWGFAQASGNIVPTDAEWTEGKFSPGNGSTTFRIPDGRGNVFRSWDDARGIDANRIIGSLQMDQLSSHSHSGSTGYVSADHAHYVSANTGGRSAAHTHGYMGPQGPSWGIDDSGGHMQYRNTDGESADHVHGFSAWTGGINTNHTHSVSVGAAGSGTEVRVRNVAMLACIKF